MTNGALTTTGYDVHAARLVRRYAPAGGVTVTALGGVDLDLTAGSVTALAGPSGSGKSTLLHLLGGMDRPDEGAIYVNGTDIAALSRTEVTGYRRTIGFVFQQFALLPGLTARDNVLIPVIPQRTRFDKRTRADELLGEVGLAGREDSLPSQLSGGQKQRVAIARALMNEPLLLLADEPTGNLDTDTGTEVFDLLLRLRTERGLTIVVATHDEPLAERCDRVVHLRDGHVVGEGPAT